MLNRFFLVIVFLSAAASIAYYFIPDFRRDVVPILTGLDVVWVLLVLAATLLHYLSEMCRWWFYLRIERVSGDRLLRRLLAIFSLTAFVTYLLPIKLGIPLRLWLLTSELSLPFKRVSALLAVDGVLSYGMWFAATLLLYVLLPHAPLPGNLFVYMALATVLVVAVAGLASRSSLLPNRWITSLEPVSVQAVLGALVVLAVDIAGYVLRHGAILQALGTDIDLPSLAFATVASITAGFLSMLPMGLGAYDVALIFLLSSFSVPVEIAVIVPLVNRAGNILVSVLMGLPASYATGVSLLTLRRRFNVQSPTGPEAGS